MFDEDEYDLEDFEVGDIAVIPRYANMVVEIIRNATEPRFGGPVLRSLPYRLVVCPVAAQVALDTGEFEINSNQLRAISPLEALAWASE